MSVYNGKDIDRVCRASGMSRGRAEALLRQYDGRPDRVLEEKCGVARVYVEPERVADAEGGLRAAWRGVADFCADAWAQLVQTGRRLVVLPGALLAGAPAALALALAALLRRTPL